ncbi:hypothetical protein DSO57_1032517 [Entomophthora muscae]|uniref:Uncharacterized protein n=1 Tax=Entomophthora muscae TaxID=34485 RepID=A0ACC2T0C8_9FUNG|nr:hypothetical protein DSO57_1032517 [Entomophthora muscae]
MEQPNSPQASHDMGPTGSHTIDHNSQPTQSFNDALDSYNEVTINTSGQAYDPLDHEITQTHDSASQGEYRENSHRHDERSGYDNPGTTLYISKLSYRTTQDTLVQEFSKFGNIQNCNLVVDPHTKESRGFGFVTYETVEAANTAIDNCQMLKIDGVIVFVEKSRRSRPRSPTPGRYSGSKPIPERRPGFNDRRDYNRNISRDNYDRPQIRYPYEREYPPRDGYNAPRIRNHDYPSRYGLKEQYPDHRMRDRGFERPPAPRGRDYYPRGERSQYPPRDPRDMPPSYSRDARDSRDFRAPRDRYPDYPRVRDPREMRDSRGVPPFDRERAPLRPREDVIPDRYRDERANHYPPARASRDHRPRYDY